MSFQSKKIYPLLVTALFAFIISCSSPLDRKFSDKTFDKDIKDIMSSGKIDSTDMGYIGLYIMKAKFSGQKIEGKTYRSLLDSAHALQQKQQNIQQSTLPAPQPK